MALHRDDIDHLRELCHRYASAVDACDFDRLGTVFTPEATLITGQGQTSGRDNIMAAMGKLERFDRTFHMLGQIGFAEDSSDPSVATGEVYCIAHHYTGTDSGTEDMLMHIVYHDTYRRIDDSWLIDVRRLDVVHQRTTAHADG